MTDVAGLVLAAGAGRRFGAPKALLSVGGVSLVERAVALLRAADCDPLVVVAGAAPLTVAGAVVVRNPEWTSGMGSSLRVGLAALSATPARAAVVALVDQPLVTPEAVRRLVASDAPVAVAAYAGEPRNPVLFARSTWAEVARLAVGDVGARPFLRAHPELVTLVECGDVADPFDIDLPEDLAELGRTRPPSPPFR